MNFHKYALYITLALTAGSAQAQYKEPEEKDKVTVFYPKSSFDSLQAKKQLTKGKATIKGVAFTHPKSSIGVKPLLSPRILANQIKITLFPVTPYFEEWYQLRKDKENKRKRRYVYLSDAAYRYRLEAITNSSGKFTFPEMKPGKYFLQGFLGYTSNGSYNEYTGTGYSSGGYQTNYYERKNYSVAHEDRIEEFVEIKEDGEIVKVKLK